MPVIDVQHLALMVGPVRVAAAGAVAAHDIGRTFESSSERLTPVVERQLKWSRRFAEGAAAGLGESLRRSRENARPDLGEPDVPEVLGELVASLAEMYAALRMARNEIVQAELSEHAEPVAGRYGELAASVATWANTATQIQMQVGERPLRPAVEWPPDPTDPRVGSPVALALATSFAVSSALGAMATIDDHRAGGGSDDAVQPIFEIAVQALWSATELASGVGVCLDHLLSDPHPWPGDAMDPEPRSVESQRNYRKAVALQLEDLDRHQPADATAARPGYEQLLSQIDEHAVILSQEVGGAS